MRIVFLNERVCSCTLQQRRKVLASAVMTFEVPQSVNVVLAPATSDSLRHVTAANAGKAYSAKKESMCFFIFIVISGTIPILVFWRLIKRATLMPTSGP